MTSPDFEFGVKLGIDSIKAHIRERRLKADREEREERMALLQEHYAKWNATRKELREDCERNGGHVWQDLPDNGFNRPHFITGEWPAKCKWCRADKPRR